ncbi:UNVERIFIED_CONTAM: hypothetical protein HDU68_008639 [Siphonaria sp. JEL0065]|nr:hypothetical protein HDU68_008639 [Siphonaria sp. JEL0065]
MAVATTVKRRKRLQQQESEDDDQESNSDNEQQQDHHRRQKSGKFSVNQKSTEIGDHMRKEGTGSLRRIYCGYCDLLIRDEHRAKWTIHVRGCGDAPTSVRRLFGGSGDDDEGGSGGGAAGEEGEDDEEEEVGAVEEVGGVQSLEGVDLMDLGEESDFSDCEEFIQMKRENTDYSEEEEKEEDEVLEGESAGESGTVKRKLIEANTTGGVKLTGATCNHCQYHIGTRSTRKCISHFVECPNTPAEVLKHFGPMVNQIELIPFPAPAPVTFADGSPNTEGYRSWKDVLKIQRPDLEQRQATGLFTTSFRRKHHIPDVRMKSYLCGEGAPGNSYAIPERLFAAFVAQVDMGLNDY